MIRTADFFGDISEVALKMRACDREEIYALFPSDAHELVALRAFKYSYYKWVLERDAAPCVAFGAYRLWPGVWSIWMFATDAARPRDIVQIVKFVRGHMLGWVAEHRIHRIECRSLATHRSAHNFIHALGLSEESRLWAYGTGREDFVVFSQLF